MQCPRYVDDIHQTSFAQHVMKRAQLNYVATLPHCGKKLHMDHLHSYVKTHYGDIDLKFWWFPIHQEYQRLMKKLPCKLRFCKCKVLISASSVWLLPQRAVSILKLKGTHSASIPTNPMVEHLQAFTSPPEENEQKIPHPLWMWNTPDFLWLPSNQYPEAHE